MKVLRDVVDLEGSTTYNVVLRNITEPYWQKVIETTEMLRVVALGTPGIGKTTSTCILIRLLLQQKKKVVYRVRTPEKDGKVYIFTPSTSSDSTSIDVEIIQEDVFKMDLINQLSTYYVVDPGSTKDNCNLPNNFKGKVIIVASADEGHWGGSDFIKWRNDVMGLFLYFPVWTMPELIHSAPYMKNKINEDEIRNRFIRFGGVPRHIFCTDVVQEVLQIEQETAINSLTAVDAGKIFYGYCDETITFRSMQPKSMLIHYINKNEGDFGGYKIVTASDVVYKLIKGKFFKGAVDTVKDQTNNTKNTFEEAVKILLTGDNPIRVKNRYCVGKSDKEYEYLVDDLIVGGCLNMLPSDSDLIEIAFKNPMNLYYSEFSNYTLFDMCYYNEVDQMLVIVQVTRGKDHTANIGHLRKTAALIKGRASSVLFLYAVTESKYGEFLTKPVNPKREANSTFEFRIIKVVRDQEDM